MKYKEHLKQSISPEYGPDAYLDYKLLDDTIRILSGRASAKASETSRVVSLTTPPPTDVKGQPISSSNPTEETFLKILDKELAKVESFTLAQVTALRAKLAELEQKLRSSPEFRNDATLYDGADAVSESFIRLETYVNVNFMGFHKILKKHDKHIPSTPCKSFYVNRMHAQAWVRGDYSDVVVRLSAIWSALRQDQTAEDKGGDAQSFLRSTSKYWIKTEDVSRVKYFILKHLPVFLQKTSTGESDSQLTNSVYLDNDQLELYHGRLDKSPGAIALRLRWYGTGEPTLVFVERKTHRDSWTGDVSVKERFMLDESEVKQIIRNTYPVEEKKKQMIARGASDEEIEDWEILVGEVTQVIQSKQLVPTMRTQCMRTAFQIPFDATVRISLDTNLCMISERGYNIQDGAVWHRDSTKTIASNEITRFPHAILEIKLELSGGSMTPPRWVQELQNSGLLYEVHKFSKFIHGCATLLPDYVRSVPYWVDDVSIRDSIIASGASRILVEETKDKKKATGPGANVIYNHLLPFGTVADDRESTAVGRTAPSMPKPTSYNTVKTGLTLGTSTTVYDDDDEDEGDNNCFFNPFISDKEYSVIAPTSVQKIEPKIMFANERTYLHWLHAGVTLSTIGAGILAFASKDPEENGWAEYYALVLLGISLGFCAYAMRVFLWRSERIKSRVPGRWDDPRGPVLLGGTLALVLTVNLVMKIVQISKYI